MKHIFLLIVISFHFIGVSLSQSDGNISDLEESLKIQSDRLEIAQTLFDMGAYYQRKGNYDLAFDNYEKSLRIRIDSLGEIDLQVAEIYHAQGNTFHNLNNFNVAEKLYYKALEIKKSILDEDHSQLGESYSDLSELNREKGNYQKALSLNKIALENRIKNLGENHPKVADTYSNLAIVYDDITNYEKALKINKIALDIRLKYYHEDHYDIAKSYNNIAIIYIKLGNYEKALESIQKAIDIKVNLLGDNHISLANSYSNISELYLQLGDYTKSMNFEEKALEIRKEILGEHNIDIAASYYTLAKASYNFGELTKSLKLARKTLNIRKEVLGEMHIEVANSYRLISQINLKLNEYNKAIEFNKKALHIWANILGEHHIYSGRSHLVFANIYYKQELYKDALRQNKKALEILTDKLGEDHHETTASLINLANINQALKNYAEADSIWYSIINNSLKRLNETYIFLSDNQRLEYAKTLTEVYKNFYSYVSKHGTETNRSLAANLSLNTKSLALDYSVSARELINSTENKKIVELHNDLNKIKKNISLAELMTKKDLDNSGFDLTDMRNQQDNISRKILADKLIKEKLYKEPLDWDNVQSQLNPDEVILDFIRVQEETCKSWVYYALLIKNNMSSPQFIRISDELTLSGLLKTSNKNGQPNYIKSENDLIALYKNIWKPISSYLNEINKVHISSAGLLHQIDFEVLQNESGNFIAEHFEIHYYNSIRDFAKIKKLNSLNKPNEKKQYLNAVLFGDITYDLSVHKESNKGTNQVFRDGIDPLPATIDEINIVGNIIEDNGGRCARIRGIHATEDVFNNYRGNNSPDIYHFATHGKYLSPLDSIGSKAALKNRMHTSGNPLQRSMLMLSGANNTWTAKKYISRSNQDGILTAYEITNMDFNDTELVVLSACNTGLGDIHDTEGVIGLQSAFKLAGVKNVLVSLWKVNDVATKDLMILFYENLLTKNQDAASALRNAKTTMRDKGAKSENWAGFILIE